MDHSTLVSTVGSQLADKLGWKFYDGDDYHPDENKKKMAEGIPLNDQDRIPWLCHLHDILMRDHASGQNAILACSALKKMYRCILENGETGCHSVSGQLEEQKEPAPQKILFVHLAGSMDLIASRLGKRRGHFMPPALLQSQFDTLEPPSAPENFITINLEMPLSEIVSGIEEYVRSLY
ncbi:probable gluconokinase isoform X2 [Elgaria multicarinata webbii]|uniref:probable gluconokinase isoform X2 n=1 Tax=Elgaria multicarinata webbii TaxID=159646 RepID=UPI002FCD5203